MSCSFVKRHVIYLTCSSAPRSRTTYLPMAKAINTFFHTFFSPETNLVQSLRNYMPDIYTKQEKIGVCW